MASRNTAPRPRRKLLLQRGRQPHFIEADLLYVSPIADAVANLPAALRDPVNEGSHDNDAENQPEQVGVKRDLEQIKRQRIIEHRIAPGGGRAAQIAAAEIANDGPGVQRGERDRQGDEKCCERRDSGVERMIGEARVGSLERQRVGDPEDNESEDGGAGGGNQAIGQDAEPGAQLAHFFPPLIVDGPGTQPTRRDEQHHATIAYQRQPPRVLAAGYLPGSIGRIQVFSNCTLLRGTKKIQGGRAWAGQRQAIGGPDHLAVDDGRDRTAAESCGREKVSCGFWKPSGSRRTSRRVRCRRW
jgi:hypothetical protein